MKRKLLKTLLGLPLFVLLAGATDACGKDECPGYYHDCPNGRLCFYEKRCFDGGPGAMLSFAEGNNDNDFGSGNVSKFPNGNDFQESVSAVVNNTDRWVGLYDHKDYLGARFCLAPKQILSNLVQWDYVGFEGSSGGGMNDDLSSHRFLPSRCDF